MFTHLIDKDMKRRVQLILKKCRAGTGAFGGDGTGFQHQHINTGLLEGMGAECSGYATADDKRGALRIVIQGGICVRQAIKDPMVG